MLLVFCTCGDNPVVLIDFSIVIMLLCEDAFINRTKSEIPSKFSI